MKALLSIFICFFSLSLFAQAPEGRMTLPELFPTEPREFEKTKVNWDDFYQQSGTANFNTGSNFAGSSVAYFQKGSSRLIYGLNIDVLAVEASAPQLLPNAFTQNFLQTAFVVPFWFTLKYRLMQNPNHVISPYVISGLGPTWGLRIRNNSNFINALSNIESEVGAGGFVGAGFDYLWAESWAISFDVRYNVIRFDSPVGLNEAYDGVSFSIGFVRAFGL